MAVKTITIDLEAYEVLASRKKPGQSFSQVIKAHLGPARNARAFKQVLRDVALSPRTLDAIEAEMTSRRRSRPRVPSL